MSNDNNWKERYEELAQQKALLALRCASHRRAVELALEWGKENGMHPATTVSNLADPAVWQRFREKWDKPKDIDNHK